MFEALGKWTGLWLTALTRSFLSNFLRLPRYRPACVSSQVEYLHQFLNFPLSISSMVSWDRGAGAFRYCCIPEKQR